MSDQDKAVELLDRARRCVETKEFFLTDGVPFAEAVVSLTASLAEKDKEIALLKSQLAEAVEGLKGIEESYRCEKKIGCPHCSAHYILELLGVEEVGK